MNNDYKPPYELTDEIVNLTIEISSLLKNLSSIQDNYDLRLRRESRIKTIYSSLAIENNALTQDQVIDVINGKTVLAPESDICEVKNAYDAYNNMAMLNPYSINDFLQAHGMLMKNIKKDAGKFRSGGVGVYRDTQLIHIGANPQLVPTLIQELFNWAEKSNVHPLIKAAVVHFEIEYIHPFSDGNGRMGRLWHSLLLSRIDPVFTWLPVESMIYARQSEYYRAINLSDKEGESTVFIAFMLKVIKDTILEHVGINDAINVGIKKDAVLKLMKENTSITAVKIARVIGLSPRQVERIIAELKKEGIITREGANKNGHWVIKMVK